MHSLSLLLRIAPQGTRAKLGLLAILTTLSSLVELVGVSLIIPFIAFAAKMSPFGTSKLMMVSLVKVLSSMGIPEDSFTLSLGLIFLLGIGISNTGLCLYQFYALKVIYTLKAQLSYNVASVIGERSIDWHDQQNSAELSKSVMTDVAHSIEFINAALQVFSIVTRSVIIFLFFLLAQPRLAALTACILGLGYWSVFSFVHRPLLRAGALAYESDLRMYRLCGELVGGVRALKVTNTTALVVETIGDSARSAIRPQIVKGMPAFITKALLETFTVGSVIALLVYFNHKDGSLSNGLPMLSAYALAGVRLIPSIQQGLYFMVQMRFYLPAINRIDSILNGSDPTTVESNGDPAEICKTMDLKKSIRLSAVCYHYAKEQPVLHDISLTIAKGQRVAFVGQTGAGKTTLIDLMLGLRFPKSGEIDIDETPLTHSSADAWRAILGYVPQNIYLRDATIAENIAFGLAQQDIDLKRVEEAARTARIHEFISSLPEGYEAQVGERGVRLSGGQCQRIGIARALYHRPEVVIFDEATSALDNATEAQVLEALDQLKGLKTLVVIAHRLNTIWDFDQIFVLDRGRLVAQGTSEELLESCETFQRLALLQKDNLSLSTIKKTVRSAVLSA